MDRASESSAAERAFLQGRPRSGPGHYLRDIVYGANDGAITTLAIVAGVSGAALSTDVALVLGAANVVADGISMGAAGYTALKSDLQQRRVPSRLERPLRHAVVTFCAFAVAGALPLFAYAPVAARGGPALLAATGVALAALAVLGVWRAPLVRRPRWRSALETVLIGAAAALAAFLVGALAQRLVG